MANRFLRLVSLGGEQRYWPSWVGLRYLQSKKNSKFLSFITVLSVIGVALGVAAMLVVLSVMDGFEEKLRERLVYSDLHILILPTETLAGFERFQGAEVDVSALDADQMERLKKECPEIQKIWPVMSTEVILRSGKKVTGLFLKGVNEDRLNHLELQVKERLEKGGSTSPLFVGQELAYEFGLLPGDLVTLTSPTETEGPFSEIPRIKSFQIAGIYHSGHPEQELQVMFTPQKKMDAFLRRSNRVSQWEVTVQHFDSAPQTANLLREKLPNFKIQDWKELNAHLFASLRLERVSMFIILAFIVVVASFNIVSTLTLMVIEKKREISILKAMGSTPSAIAHIFLVEGSLIGFLGIGLGTIAGFLVCVALKRYEFIQLPEIYYDPTLPVAFNGWYYLFIPISAWIIVICACLYPAQKAQKLQPLEGIRLS